MSRPDYAPGQAWTYRTRPGEDDSRVVIRAITAEPDDGDVVHASILDARIRNHRVDGGIQPAMHHVALSRKALDASVLHYQGEATPDDRWQDGYAVWRQAYDNGDAGVFDIPVAEVLAYLERVIAASGEVGR